MTAGLGGIRAACFYPWNPFEPTGAWSRFTCLWRYLLEEGAGVTLAFLDKGKDADLRGISVRFAGQSVYGDNPHTITRAIARVLSAAELKEYSRAEIDLLVRYELSSSPSSPGVGSWLEKIVADHDVVTCEYPFLAPLLAGCCRNLRKPLVVTSHDALFELHGSHPKARERLKQLELRAMRLADAVVFCNDRERELFAAEGLRGPTVLNTGDVLGVTPGQEDACRDSVRARLKIKSPHYGLFVGTAHGPNVEAANEVRKIALAMPDLTFVVAGSCCAKVVENNFIATGRVSDELLEALYRGARVVIIPLLHGTGMSVKIFQAFIHGKGVVSTPAGARGHQVADGRELLLAATPGEFPAAIRRVLTDATLRAGLGGQARRYAEALDFRSHFRPYGEIVAGLVARTGSGRPGDGGALVLVDNQLTDRVGHHFNYALAMQEQCAAQGVGFHALVNRAAQGEVLEGLSARATFSLGLHDEAPMNPYPPEWRNLRSLYDFLLSNDCFARELEAGLTGLARPGDLVVIPNATARQMLGLAVLLQRSPIFATLKYVLILRYSLQLPTGSLAERRTARNNEEADRYSLAIEKLLTVAPPGTVRFATDSAALAKEYGAFCLRPIEILPIPHTEPSHPASAPPEIPPRSPQKIRAVFLGDAREEKGFSLLPAALRAVAASPLQESAQFVFQAFITSQYHLKMGQVIREIKRLNLPNVHLIEDPLAAEAYQALLGTADLVLLPYDAATYGARTSGPFVEAICAGKPVVIPDNSWMSAQLGSSRAGVTFTSGNAQDFARAVLAALRSHAELQQAAMALGAEFRRFHNPASFFRQLLPDRRQG